MVKAYVLDTQDQVSLEYLEKIGVLYWRLNPATYEQDGELSKIRSERNFSYSDIIITDRAHIPNYDEKMKIFFAEHIHTDDEVRFFIEGSGYFDVRDQVDRWIRIHCTAGDLIILPAGIYHRFRNDESEFAKVMRLFVGDPVWTPFNRSDEKTNLFPQRLNYLKSLAQKTTPGRINIYIKNPSDFDRVIFSLSEKSAEKIIVFFIASDDPQTNQPWCPDVRKAQPLVEQILSELNGNYFFVQCPIVKEEYKGNNDYYYRVHEKIKLTKIPTMGLWVDGKMEKRLVEGELHELENIRKFLLDK